MGRWRGTRAAGCGSPRTFLLPAAQAAVQRTAGKKKQGPEPLQILPPHLKACCPQGSADPQLTRMCSSPNAAVATCGRMASAVRAISIPSRVTMSW